MVIDKRPQSWLFMPRSMRPPDAPLRFLPQEHIGKQTD
ncbi:hypothetical protein X737_09180 [Mesorhizobium sp. L48C026A00]|nr:hypothetical protein X737_09180 [Mesorhizobium sp. L48C026A00]